MNWKAISTLSVLFLGACETEEKKPVGPTIVVQEPSEESKFVKSLVPIIDERYSPPLCFLVGKFNSGMVVVPIDCKVVTRGKMEIIQHETIRNPDAGPPKATKKIEVPPHIKALYGPKPDTRPACWPNCPAEAAEPDSGRR